jgi:hypothetical protein
VKRSEKPGCAARAGGKIFSATSRIQPRLPRFENNAHPAVPHDFDNFQFRKSRPHVFDGRGVGDSRRRPKVGAAAASKTHDGHKPPGASGGMGDWH